MRGQSEQQDAMFSYVSAEKRVPQEHPLRAVRRMGDAALGALSERFDKLYSATGRPSIPPEQLLRALLLQLLYTVRSERLLMEQLDYNLLFRWFVGLQLDDAVWDATVFSKNRERLIAGDIAQAFFQAVLEQARAAGLLSDEHFTVDGTVIEAYASRKSVQPKAEPPARGSGHGGKLLLRDTHESRTDPEARLFKRGVGAARPSYLGHLITENRHGLVVEACVTQASTRAEREAALLMLERSPRREGSTLGADKAYQERRFIEQLRQMKITPHVAEYATTKPGFNWLSAAERQDERLATSQQKRKLIEKAFGWMKQIAGQRRTRFRGRERIQWMFQFAAAGLNLLRISRLVPQPV